MLARQITLPRPFPTKLTPLFRYSCRLFVVLKKVNPFGIKQIRTLFAKYRGVGVLTHASLSDSATPTLVSAPTPRSLRLRHSFTPIFEGSLATRLPRSARDHFLLSPFRFNTCRFNTCKSASKQRTLSPSKMNTYEKQGEGGTKRSGKTPSPRASASLGVSLPRASKGALSLFRRRLPTGTHFPFNRRSTPRSPLRTAIGYLWPECVMRAMKSRRLSATVAPANSARSAGLHLPIVVLMAAAHLSIPSASG
jgi:hypothetical protein